LVDLRGTDGDAILARIHGAMVASAEAMPTHADFVRQHCSAEAP
jgi:hypothetical protein